MKSSIFFSRQKLFICKQKKNEYFFTVGMYIGEKYNALVRLLKIIQAVCTNLQQKFSEGTLFTAHKVFFVWKFQNYREKKSLIDLPL